MGKQGFLQRYQGNRRNVIYIKIKLKKIAIIGASYLQLPLVLKAKSMGIETHCFAWEDGAVCKEVSDYFYNISVLDKEKILEKCREIRIDGITTIATDMAVPTICFVAEMLGLVSNSYESSLISTNKNLMRQKFIEFDVNSPKFIEVDQYSKNLFIGFKFPLIVKPVDRSGSRGVSKVDTESELIEAINIACDESFVHKSIVEEFIEGDEVSVETISWKGNHYILTVTDKTTTGSPHFVELAHHQPSQLPVKVLNTIQEETIKALNAVGVEYGAGHTEFRITNMGDVFILEVGARMGGDFIGSHLVELSTGYDFLRGVINIALNNFEKPSVKKKAASGVFFLCKETEEIRVFFEKSNEFDIEKQILNDDLKAITNSNDRSGYLIYQSNQKVTLS